MVHRITAVAWLVLAVVGCKGKDDDDGDDAPGGVDTDTDAAPDTDGPPAPVGPPDVRVDGAEGLATDPQSADVHLCVTTAGAVVVAWTDDRDGILAVYARRSPDGGVTWPAPPIRFGLPEAVAEHPDLACDGGSAILAWEDWRDGVNPNVYVASSADGGGVWAEPVRVTGDFFAEHAHLAPRIAAAEGRVHVAWYGDAYGAYDVLSARSADGGLTFDPPVRVGGDDPGSAWSAHPEIATDGDDVHVAWEDRRTGKIDIHVASSGNRGTGFPGDARVDDGEADSYAPTLHASAGVVHVAWHDRRDGDAYEVYVARSADGGGTFAPPLRLSDGEPKGTVDAVLPQLGEAGGLLHAVWYGAADGGYHILHRALADGAPTGPSARLDTAPGLALARYPQLAVDGADVVVAWQDGRDAAAEAQGDLYYTFSEDGGATFAPDLRLDGRAPGGPLASDLAIAVQGGVLLAAWTDARSGTADVWLGRLTLGLSGALPVPPP